MAMLSFHDTMYVARGLSVITTLIQKLHVIVAKP